MGSKLIKRLFDICVSLLLLFVLLPFILIFWIISSINTQSNGFFFQERIGQYGKVFTIYKLKSIHPKTRIISKWGSWMRKYKVDELPQLLNVLKGDMSIVGPRPDIAGYYDRLQGEERKLLELKPGLTSEASIKYASEEAILALEEDPARFNDEILFPDKLQMNLAYYHAQSLFLDIKIIIKTVQTFCQQRK